MTTHSTNNMSTLIGAQLIVEKSKRRDVQRRYDYLLFVYFLILPSLLHPSILLNRFLYLYYTERKILFRRSLFLYSPYPNLEGIEDALFYKFRRHTISQNYSAVCTNKGGHRDAFLNERYEALRILRGLLSRPLSLERSERRSLFFVIAWWQI